MGVISVLCPSKLNCKPLHTANLSNATWDWQNEVQEMQRYNCKKSCKYTFVHSFSIFTRKPKPTSSGGINFRCVSMSESRLKRDNALLVTSNIVETGNPVNTGKVNTEDLCHYNVV
jgi:hypothetical protein